LEETWGKEALSSAPIHEILSDLARWGGHFVADSRARRYFIDKVEPVFVDAEALCGVLAGGLDWEAAREIAALGLHIAELEGNRLAQITFEEAIKRIAPLTSPQRSWVIGRLGQLA
jgi:hypothetical protein